MASNNEIIDFYKQLALLTKSELPLPETLRQLAETADSKEMKLELKRLGDETAKGRKLSDVMKENPKLFTPFFASMVGAGERNGTLPAVLAELAAIARANGLLTMLVKDILLYPIITISLAFLGLILLCYFIIPEFATIFRELLGDTPLPVITTFVLGVSAIIHDYITVFVVLYLILIAGVLWLFSGGRMANAVMLYFIRLMPMSEMIFYNMAMARVCTLWSAMMKQRTPDPDALRAIASLVELPALSKALSEAADACANGTPVSKALSEQLCVSRLLCLSVSSNPEAVLPEELGKLSTLFLERSHYGFRRTGLAWELISICGMAFVVGGVALFLFIPLITKMIAG